MLWAGVRREYVRTAKFAKESIKFQLLKQLEPQKKGLKREEKIAEKTAASTTRRICE